VKFSDIKIQHCYNVIFDEVRDCEFDGKHLAIVLKKNNDSKTAIVVPLTRTENGDNYNKVNIGFISTLPSSLNSSPSYVVYNQVRTVNANRMINLKEGSNLIHSKVDDEVFREVLKLCSLEIAKSYTDEEQEQFYLEMANEARTRRIIDLTYQYISKKRELTGVTNSQKQFLIQSEIEEIMSKVSELHNPSLPIQKCLTTQNFTDKIEDIINEMIFVKN
jgi:uncharacterized protein YifN (PemK superfamily)